MRWKDLTGTSRVLLMLAVALLVLPLLTLDIEVCTFGLYPNGGGCGITFLGVGPVIPSYLWPLVFVPGALAMFGFVYSVKWGHW